VTRVLYPGSFDPIHNGHVELIRTAASLFGEVVVAAMRNPSKSTPLFSDDERVELIEASLSDVPNVRVVLFGELVVSLAATENVDFIVKGLRGAADLDSEMQMAQTNKTISGVETVFLPTTTSTGHIASRFIREIARMGEDVSAMVPRPVLQRLQEKFAS